VFVPCYATSVQIPVGAFISVVASLVLPKLSIPLTPPAIDAFLRFVGGFSVSITSSGVTYVEGHIINYGGLDCGTDSSVEVYVRESILNYRFASGCTVRAPLGLFVEARP
ncbi:MAG: hypothetical protein QXZ31_03235, partial [Thermofilaceae archaeon]